MAHMVIIIKYNNSAGSEKQHVSDSSFSRSVISVNRSKLVLQDLLTKLLLEIRRSLTYPMLDLNLALQPSTASTAKIQI